MTITSLDPSTALIVIDLQNGLLAYPTVHPLDAVVAVSADLAAAFRRRGLPVALVTAAGGAPGRTERQRPVQAPPPGWSDLAPELNAQPSDILIVKRTWGAFTNTDLENQLRSRGVTQVVITGVATSMGVESTARQAYELGFNVTLAIDAMTDLSIEAHDNSIQRIFPRLGETGASERVIELLKA